MPAFRLRVRTTEIDLPVGELVMGRGSDCFLRIDDDLVSRRHARLVVGGDSVIFEDLGSRNGSRVNGQKAEGSIPLKVGDTFEVGAQQFQLITAETRERVSRTMLPHRPCRKCGVLIEAAAPVCPKCGASQRDSVPAGSTSPPVPPAAPDDEPKTAAFASSFALVAGLGDKLLALGRTEEAERMLGPRLKDLLERAREGDLSDAKVVTEAIRRALRLAALTSRDDWYAYVFDLARLHRLRLDGAAVDELHARMMVQKPAIAEHVMFYFAAQEGDDEATQLHRKRLEALLRFCRG